MRSDFLPRKGLLYLYDKQNNTWLLVDMEFPFSCSLLFFEVVVEIFEVVVDGFRWF